MDVDFTVLYYERIFNLYVIIFKFPSTIVMYFSSCVVGFIGIIIYVFFRYLIGFKYIGFKYINI